MSFLGEIKRRKVFQIAAVYAVMAWLIIQVVDVVSEPLSLPDWLDTVVIVLLAVGFPIAVVLAWAFDLTSRGIEQASNERTVAAQPFGPGQSLTFIIQALVLFAVAFLALDQYFFEPPAISTDSSAASTMTSLRRFDYDLPEGHAFRNPGRRVMDFASDGRHFVYSTFDGLYLRPLDELDPQLIPGTGQFLSSPTFSPDGDSVAYWDGDSQQIVRVSIRGGASQTIADVPDNPDGLSWPTDDTILFSNDDGFHRVSAASGTPEPLILTGEAEQVNDPQILPGGDLVLFGVGPFADWDAAQIVVESLSTGDREVLIVGGNGARYLSTGHIVYARDDTLFGVAFDLDALDVSGAAVPLIEGVMRPNFTGSANYAVSNDGTLVYVRGNAGGNEVELVWVDRQGNEEPIPAEPDNYSTLRLSPDGRYLATSIVDGDSSDIWIYDLEANFLRRFTVDSAQDARPVWTPDGQRILFSSGRGGERGLYSKPADGLGEAELLWPGRNVQRPESFSPDGRHLVYREEDPSDVNSNLRLLSMDGEISSVPLLVTEFDEDASAISPDGNWIAYASNETGRKETYVSPFPNIESGKLPISSGGGVEPAWAPDGSELYYLVEDGPMIRLMAVEVETTPTFSSGAPRQLFRGAYHFFGPGLPAYAVAPDGERFLMKKEAGLSRETVEPPQFVIVENWFEELRRLAPTE